jgi:hypothetical protein
MNIANKVSIKISGRLTAKHFAMLAQSRGSPP